MFHWRSTVRSTGRCVDLGFTDRSAARGHGPYAGLNLGGHVGDDASDVEGNRAALAAQVGVGRRHLLLLNQVHGARVVEATGPWPADPASLDSPRHGVSCAPDADAVVTATPGLSLAVLVADCVPVLLHDVEAGVVGAVHAGRPGLMAGVVGAAVGALRDLGATAVSAAVGPSVCGRCYEVPPAMAAAAAEVAPSSMTRSWTGTTAIDVAAGVVEQLVAADVAVHWVPGCTRESPSLYSYRRDAVTGRFAGVVTMTERASTGPAT